MKLVRVGAAILNQTPLDWDGNKRRISGAIAAARQQGVTILCLPELCITGYGCEDAFHAVGTQQYALQVLGELLPETHGMIVSLGVPLLYGSGLYNTCCLAADGKLLGFVGKQNLAGEGIHYEPRWFKPWPSDKQVTTHVMGRNIPLGDLIFECGGVRLGFEICEDAWVAERPGGNLAQRGVDLILNPSASHFAFGKHEVRKRFVTEGSRAFNVGYLYANLLGNESGRAIYDGDAMIAAAGKLIATGSRFSYADWQVTSAVLDVDAIRMSRARLASFRPEIMDEDRGSIRCDFSFPTLEPERAAPMEVSWESSLRLKEEEFTRAVSLALFDYLRKSRSRGFVVSLSGGADSTAVSLLVASSVALAIADIGREAFLQKLSYISGLGDAKGTSDKDTKGIVRQLLTCAYQSTRNSGPVTRNAARTVAEALGAEYLELDVDALVQGYINVVSGELGRPLDWQTDDIALQNIQARVRSPSVWMLANIKGALLLSTSNRSEAAVGYATMDGDTSGGLSPIAGIDKNFIRHWLRWFEKEGPLGNDSYLGGPLPALVVVNEQAPTAELRPAASKQTDEDDLMPYDLLDAIERAAIRDKMSPIDIWRVMQVEFPQHSGRQLGAWVERFFRLWCRNQWKRERYAPSFHLDDENLDPKTWCRFPILSGGYERELSELRKLIDRTNSTDE
ncbi:Glutamine-dependent NAD(+) synthetase [Anatilimnocola aggregata]|uniref:Glutamine-dependent NAD(+) synthetase n=1 Tax=Anatilimnocola aggregata TaxID=2528021 RepID=A0A517YHW5_9BACT|nr:NAD(+) synthase [Anatilimnocola aggregata]QDU29823.1 Glutamine-dependent NAD(+) synthetase [Anatilimnocola aggregata]